MIWYLKFVFSGLSGLGIYDMKPEQQYQGLIDLAERLNITVLEQNLAKTGLRVRSGLCKVKGKYIFVMDKKKSLLEKIELLSEGLSQMPLENIFIVPAIRELLTVRAHHGKTLNDTGNGNNR